MTDIDELRRRHDALKEERTSWEADWKKLAAHFLPRKCRLEGDTAQTNRGGLRGEKLDSTAFYAMRDLAAGLHGGLTSPARPWFNLTLPEQDLMRASGVKIWLDEVTRRMRFVYHRSNFYNAISLFYAELATFGTAFMFEVEDEDTGIRFIPLTAGECCLDADAQGRVDTVFHSMTMTLRQLVQKFGEAALPPNLRALSREARNWNERFQVVHAVYPNPDTQGAGRAAGRTRAMQTIKQMPNQMPGQTPAQAPNQMPGQTPGQTGTHLLAQSPGHASSRMAAGEAGGAASLLGQAASGPEAHAAGELPPAALRPEEAQDPAAKPYLSVYYLDGQSGGMHGPKGDYGGRAVLREGGFHEFPGFGVRWDVTGGDVYGKGPAYDTLADSVLLQQMTQSVLKALHKEIDPPLAAQADFEGISLLPGAVNVVRGGMGGAANQAVYPILQVRHNVEGTYRVIAQIQNKIREGLFNNLFRMLLGSDRRQITAREVAAREEEKLILIGPVLERLNDEFFIPLTTRTFNMLYRAGKLPPAPEAIRGASMQVDFVSILAQAQKMVSTGAVEQFAAFVGNVARMYPDAADTINLDAMIDDYADYLGIEGDMLRARDEREALRRARKEREAQAEQMQQMMSAAKTLPGAIKDLGAAGMQGSALGALVQGMGGVDA